MSMYLYRLAQWCFRHRWATVATWLVAVFGIVFVGMLSGGKTTDAVTIPGTEAQKALSVLEQKLPSASGGSTQVVFADTDGDITSPANQQAISAAVARLADLDHVVSATSPFQSKLVSPDKKIALATVSYDVPNAEVPDSTLDKLDSAVSPATDSGVQVEFGGGVYPKASHLPLSEVIGVVVALVVLLITFGSFVAAGLPIITAVVGVAISMMGITALASVFDVASSATSVAMLLGLSCGIDYALFILARYRNYLMEGLEPQEAAGRAAGTAGSSVVFAGLSVVIALCGLVVVGIPFLTVMGLTAAGAVTLALLVAITLVPALFGLLGHRAGRYSTRSLLRRAEPAARMAATEPEKLTGTRYSRWVVKRRIPVLITGVTLLAVMCLPIFKMDLGLPSAKSLPGDDTSRQAYELTTEHFGAGYNGVLTVVAENVTSEATAARLATSLGQEQNVTSSSVGLVTNGIALISVVPSTGPSDPATADLVDRIRDDRARIVAGTGATYLVGGLVATNIDVSSKLNSALPVFLLTIAGLAFVLLTFAFRTILVPLKSIVGFLLSTGAALGAQIAVFQWGWFSGLLGVEPGQTLSFLPIILLAIMFGLSSDYEVFVVSRIKEQFTKTGDARQASVLGTGQSARVVTAAALIMAAIFIATMASSDPNLKAIGLSFGLGVFLDAFVVRLTLVPAFMAICGSKIWYHPRWFAKYVPDADIEGEKLDAELARRARAAEDVTGGATGDPDAPAEAERKPVPA